MPQCRRRAARPTRAPTGRCRGRVSLASTSISFVTPTTADLGVGVGHRRGVRSDIVDHRHQHRAGHRVVDGRRDSVYSNVASGAAPASARDHQLVAVDPHVEARPGSRVRRARRSSGRRRGRCRWRARSTRCSSAWRSAERVGRAIGGRLRRSLWGAISTDHLDRVRRPRRTSRPVGTRTWRRPDDVARRRVLQRRLAGRPLGLGDRAAAVAHGERPICSASRSGSMSLASTSTITGVSMRGLDRCRAADRCGVRGVGGQQLHGDGGRGLVCRCRRRSCTSNWSRPDGVGLRRVQHRRRARDGDGAAVAVRRPPTTAIASPSGS